MASKQLQLYKQEQEKEIAQGWMSIFESNLMTHQGSRIFVKQLTAVAFSCITYMRSIFPEYAYREKAIGDIKVKLLKGNHECKDAYLMTRWIKSAFTALDEKYMRELVLEFLTKEQEPLEYYAIQYTYSDEGASCALSTGSQTLINFDPTEIQKATKMLIETLLNITENLESLPHSYLLQLRINYYDEITPPHFRPKFFIDAEPCEWDRVEHLGRCNVGSVATAHHSLALSIGSTLVSNEELEHFFCTKTVIADVHHNEEVTKPPIKEQIINLSPDNEAIVPATPSPKKIKLEPQSKLNTNWTWTFDKSANSAEDFEETLRLQQREPKGSRQANCICNQPFGNKNIFQCEFCKKWQHLICYKISPEGRDPEIKCCFLCAKTQGKVCTDPSLMKYKTTQAKQLGIYRQVLFKCQGLKTLSVKTLQNFGIPSEISDNLMKKLLEENFIRPKKNSRLLFNINKYHLTAFLNKYLKQ